MTSKIKINFQIPALILLILLFGCSSIYSQTGAQPVEKIPKGSEKSTNKDKVKEENKENAKEKFYKGDEYYYQYDDPKWKTEFLPKHDLSSKNEKIIKTKKHFYVDKSGLIACGSFDSKHNSPLQFYKKDKSWMYNNLGVKKYRSIANDDKKYDETLNELFIYYSEGIKKAPRFFPFYYNLAMLSLRLKKYLKAKIYFEQSFKMIPEFWGSLIGLGRAYEKLGDKLNALNSYKLAIRNNPANFDAGIALGDYYLKEKLYSRSARYYNYVNKKFPGHHASLTGLGKIAYFRKSYFEATFIFQMIAFGKLENEKIFYEKDVHYYYARALIEMREYKQAVIQYDKLLAHPEDLFFIEVPYPTVKKLRQVAEQLAKVKALEY